MVYINKATDYIQLPRIKIMTVILCGKFLKGEEVYIKGKSLVLAMAYVGK